MGSLRSSRRVGIRCYYTRTYLRKLKQGNPPLTAIYRSALVKLPKGSPEYQALLESGKIWENHFRPQNLEPYLAAQSKLKETLKCVDELQDIMRERDHRFNSITRSLVAQYARQSTSIKSHSLPIGPVSVIAEELDRRFFKNIDNLASMKASDLAGLRLPSAVALLPGADERRVNKIRNHLVVSRYLFKLALPNPGTSGVPLSDISSLCSIILAGTQAEVNHWFKRIRPGDYRNLLVRLASNPKRIFPYQFEVPGCMERFIQWRDQMHHAQQLHPLILATHIYVYFTHIHPFPYGKGTMGRSLMADYMTRQKYIPVVFFHI